MPKATKKTPPSRKATEGQASPTPSRSQPSHEATARHSSAAFDSAYAKLNAAQKKAVDTIEGPVMVIAGPGTGKTHVLTMRIANIRRETDTPPDAILALTFTEAAVAEMRARLTALMHSPSDAYHVSLNTFHGFANDIIQAYPEHFPELAGGANVTEWEQVKIMERLVDTVPLETLRPRGNRFLYVRPALNAIQKLKGEGVTPDRFAVLLREEETAFKNIPDLINEKGKYEGRMKTKYQGLADQLARNKELIELYRAYETELTKTRAYDFTDMILKVKAKLEEGHSDADSGTRFSPSTTLRVEENSLLRSLQEEYLYILVDEHQDTNKAQNRLIELLASAWDEPNLFVVGDEEQAIYRFQGASLENFLYFQKHFRNVTEIELTANYRSPQSVLDAAHHLTNPERPKQKLIANTAPSTGSGPKVGFFEFETAETETYFLAAHIAERIALGAAPEQVAVLYRNNRDAAPIARMLERLGIPYAIESGHDILKDEDMRKLVLILKAVQRYGAPEDLAPLLYIDFLKIPPLDAWKLTTFANREKPRKNLYDVIRSPQWLEAAGVENAETILSLARYLSLWKTAAKNNGVIEAFADIVRESGFLAHVMGKPDGYEKIAKLHGLYEILRNLLGTNRSATLEQFFEYLTLAETYGLRLESPAGTPPQGRVRLMTAHRSKGREFDFVYLVNADDRHWGEKQDRSPLKLPRRVFAILDQANAALAEATEEDERHLFYVALTRAKQAAIISYARQNADGREQNASRFIGLIRPELIARGDPARFATEFAARRTELAFTPAPVRTPALADKEFLNQLFREQGLSPTALNNYLACPWRYFFQNLIRIPGPPNASLSYGNAVHKALEQYFENWRTNGSDPRVEYLIERFEHAIRREPLSDSEYEDAVKRGQKALTGYYAKYHATWNANVLTEERFRTELDEGLIVNGKLDKLEKIDGGNAVVVVDYKTGKIKSRGMMDGSTKLTTSGSDKLTTGGSTKLPSTSLGTSTTRGDSDEELNSAEAAGDYKRQLIFYKLLLDHDGRFVMRAGEIDFIEPDRHGQFKKEPFLVQDSEVAELETTIRRVAKEITDLAFWETGDCADPRCTGCPYRRMMK